VGQHRDRITSPGRRAPGDRCANLLDAVAAPSVTVGDTIGFAPVNAVVGIDVGGAFTDLFQPGIEGGRHHCGDRP
jgi:hypothetical protein